MRVSIQVADDIVVIDRVAKQVDCAPLRSNRISAIQWYGDHGEIEFERHHKPNEVFHSFEEFQSLVTAAKPIPSPKPPTPQELDEMRNRFMLEHPDARQAWIERDAEIKRLFDRAAQPAQPQPRPPNTPAPATLPPNPQHPPDPVPPAPMPQNPMTPPKAETKQEKPKTNQRRNDDTSTKLD
jgi:hypothetical protein